MAKMSFFYTVFLADYEEYKIILLTPNFITILNIYYLETWVWSEDFDKILLPR